MTIRMIDYYVKHLPFDARQEIFEALAQINENRIEKILEKDKGYPIYRSMGYTDEQIANQLRKTTVKFQNANELMIENGRPPLFDDPFDTFKSALRYVEIMRKYRQDETDSKYHTRDIFGKEIEWADVLVEKMGCSWDDYIPDKYPY